MRERPSKKKKKSRVFFSVWTLSLLILTLALTLIFTHLAHNRSTAPFFHKLRELSSRYQRHFFKEIVRSRYEEKRLLAEGIVLSSLLREGVNISEAIRREERNFNEYSGESSCVYLEVSLCKDIYPSFLSGIKNQARLNGLSLKKTPIVRESQRQISLLWRRKPLLILNAFLMNHFEAGLVPQGAIVMDDLGFDVEVVNELLEMGLDFTFSILPSRPYSKRIARRVHEEGYEIILHLPMEPKGYPYKDPGEGALFTNMYENEIIQVLDEDIEAVPFIKGVNNHMGSQFTEDEERMRIVFEGLRVRGLYFLDSLTSPRSKGYLLAREMGVKAARRNIFLDVYPSQPEIEKSIDRFIELIRARGKGIAICHPYPSTLNALWNTVPLFKKNGISIVRLSHLVM